jgi:hypothetical protein
MQAKLQDYRAERGPGEQSRKAADIEETHSHRVNYLMIGDPELKSYRALLHAAGQCHGAHGVRDPSQAASALQATKIELESTLAKLARRLILWPLPNLHRGS